MCIKHSYSVLSYRYLCVYEVRQIFDFAVILKKWFQIKDLAKCQPENYCIFKRYVSYT
jgi:hypothetical protein